MTHIDWIKGLRSHEKDSYRILFEEYYVRFVRVAERYVDSDSAKDIVQETFVKLYMKPPSALNDEMALKSYLYAAVWRRCLNFLRHDRVHRRFVDRTLDGSTPQVLMLDDEILVKLEEAIDTLPEHYRRVLELSTEGFKIEEIAQTMHVSDDAVKAYKKRALNSLRQMMKSVLA